MTVEGGGVVEQGEDVDVARMALTRFMVEKPKKPVPDVRPLGVRMVDLWGSWKRARAFMVARPK